MKRFDFESVKSRMIANLRMKSDWALILGNGTVGNLIDTIAESEAELARYNEFLLGEKKWKTAMNMSSLQANADLISYKRQLPKSAIGYVVVSHTDESNNNRLQYYGNYFFDLDATSDYDNLEKDTDADEEAKHALVPWTCDTSYTIPKGTRFVAANGTEYFSTEVATVKTLKKGIDSMSSSELESFYARGGWKSIKYLKVPVMQGIQKTVSIGQTSSSVRFQSFTLPTLDVDAAANEISCKYFSVYVKPKSGGEPVYFTEINRLAMASSIDNVFEKSILKDESGIKIKFGDSVSGAIPPEGTLYVNYVETLGESGNLDAKYQINTMIFPSGYSMKDPRSGTYSSFLSCTNTAAIQGGKDIEDISDFRNNAPASYLKSYTIATNKAYLDAINKYSPLNLLHCKIFPDSGISSEQLDVTIGEDTTEEVANELNTLSDNINITAMLANGELIADEDVEDSFLSPLQTSIYDMKGPSDNIRFVQPNLIEVVPSIKISSSSYDYTESEISDYVKEIIAQDYDIFNQDFNEPIYSSKIIALAKSFKFSDSVNLILEAVANVDYDSIDIFSYENDSDSLLADQYIVKIPFSFDTVYMTDELYKGFKDCTSNADYLLKADLLFINDTTKTTKNRTFFLYDNRIDETGATTIGAAKELLLDNSSSKTLPYEAAVNNYGYYVFPRSDEDYNSRQVRVAQYDLVEKVTDASYMKTLKDFSKSPSENRPFETDYTGAYVKYQNLESTSGYENVSTGSSEYYKTNSKYIYGVDIDFTMDENTNTLTGYFYIPINYFGFTSITGTTKPDTDKLISLLKQYVNLRVYAQPKMQDFTPQNINDIIYVNKDYIKVEKVQL